MSLGIATRVHLSTSSDDDDDWVELPAVTVGTLPALVPNDSGIDAHGKSCQSTSNVSENQLSVRSDDGPGSLCETSSTQLQAGTARPTARRSVSRTIRPTRRSLVLPTNFAAGRRGYAVTQQSGRRRLDCGRHRCRRTETADVGYKRKKRPTPRPKAESTTVDSTAIDMPPDC